MKVLIVILELYLCEGYIKNSGPQIIPSIGEVWPEPKFVTKQDNHFKIDPHDFDFVVIGYTCDILQNALMRYTEILHLSVDSLIRHKIETFNYKSVSIKKFFVNLTSICETVPHLEMDESYFIATESSQIMANSIWGMLRALETFSQLLTPDPYEMLCIRNIVIRDEPRFPHRGLLLDTSRHYISVDTILTILDGMSYNKLNVFHWHIVDDESFPYQSINYPEMYEDGAYSQSMIYTQKNILEIIEYARMRGIRIVAEFNIPVLTRFWGNYHPEIRIDCGYSFKDQLLFEPLNPIENSTYGFLEAFFSEVLEVFPDKFMYIGGDEVGLECWETNENMMHYLEINNITFQYLQHKVLESVSLLLTAKAFTPILWQYSMALDVQMPKDTVVQVWQNDWKYYLGLHTSSGHRVLLSSCWYLDILEKNWLDDYNCEPLNFHGNHKQNKLVIGGEAIMWGEVVNSGNVVQRIFPRVSATAEKLWATNQYYSIEERLEEHTCRMILRGVPAQPPSGAGIC